eukprot:TRINITY_DN8144_c0_g1_i1.p1 TRINITY_DN8144_c0_g1~~TRINITY_DN8144_c0_g1_i1.p1  ORF type:complete len:393 (-),score=62.46 TRINITY_DN8144_c0_g1_i1:94-1272(-)
MSIEMDGAGFKVFDHNDSLSLMRDSSIRSIHIDDDKSSTVSSRHSSHFSLSEITLQSFEDVIFLELQKNYPDLCFSSNSKQLLISFLRDILEFVVVESGDRSKISKQTIVTSELIKEAIKNILVPSPSTSLSIFNSYSNISSADITMHEIPANLDPAQVISTYYLTVDRCVDAMSKAILVDQRWKSIGSKKGVKMYQQKSALRTGDVCIKGIVEVEGTPEFVANLLWDSNFNKNYKKTSQRNFDCLLRTGDMLQTLDTCTEIRHLIVQKNKQNCLFQCGRPETMLSYCLLHHKYTRADGSFIITSTSVSNKSCPKTEELLVDCVRVKTLPFGYVISPLTANTTALIFVVYYQENELEKDPMKKFALKKAPSCLYNVKKCAKAYRKGKKPSTT